MRLHPILHILHLRALHLHPLHLHLFITTQVALHHARWHRWVVLAVGSESSAE